MMIKIDELEKVFNENKNPVNALKQKKYLKDNFEFIGLAKPIRAELEKEFINSYKLASINEIMTVVKELHNKKYREYMYTAQTLLLKNIKKIKYENLEEITYLTTINSWWENTDGYMAIIKRWLKQNPACIEKFITTYYKNDNFWIRRLTIICQLALKEETNFEMLKITIEYNISDNEFFIQKAIGWALRDYSKSNPKAVKEYIEKNKAKLSNLVIKEGSKYI